MRARSIRARILQSIVLCGLFAVAVLTAWAFVPEKAPDPPTPSQQRAIKLGNWDYQKVCPAGHETEIIIGQTQLHLEMKILSLLTIEDFQDVPVGCPAHPIFARSVYFYRMTKELHGIYERYGLRLRRLRLDRAKSGYYVGPSEIPEAPEHRYVIEGVGWVDDITDQRPFPHNELGKSYRLQHLSSASDTASPAAFMTCSGDPAREGSLGRACQTTYLLSGDLRVFYDFRQDKQYAHDEQFWKLAPEGPIKEPEGFLVMDAGVRAWIDEMRHKRDVSE